MGEGAYVVFVIAAFVLLYKQIPLVRRNQEIGGPGVGFAFFGAVCSFDFEKAFFLSMEQNVRCFVKEREPQMIVSFVTETLLYQRLMGRKPPCETADVGLGKFGYDDKGNSRL